MQEEGRSASNSMQTDFVSFRLNRLSFRPTYYLRASSLCEFPRFMTVVYVPVHQASLGLRQPLR